MINLIGLKRSINLKQFNLPYEGLISTFLLNANNRLLLHVSYENNSKSNNYAYQLRTFHFTYAYNHKRLIYKNYLLTSLLSLVFLYLLLILLMSLSS